jgi:predicted signal transduction protein with EAL and GGDEF domain
VRGSDLVARLGGDEFAVLLTGLADPEQAEPVATQLLAALNQPVEYEGLHLSVDGSIGIACHPDDADTSEELFRRCDVAMYQAKADRGAWLRYDPLRDDSSVQRLALVGELRAAIEDQIVVYFQPQVDLKTGTIVGAEALVRWQHPDRGLLQPSEFIGVAEQSGLVRMFTLRVLDQAIEECVRWQRPGRSVSVAVNLGARTLLDRGLPEDIANLLSKHGLPPQSLVLEITETTAASELEVVEIVLGQLRRLGVEISVDDFGTGYSSLAFLQRTAVHELKVDQSFVSGMLVNDNDLALVRATVSLAHSLGARAVAEGVESQALQVALQSLGCDVAQGYHLGRPMPAEAMRVLLSGQLAGIPLPRTESDRRLIVLPGNTG